ncbi:reverse transcriptase domain-containing protein, partial [Tanacetum coccineum]
MEAQYGKFLDMIRSVRINVPLVDLLEGMPNYGKFLKELVSNKHKFEQISPAFLSDESSTMIQNKVPPKLGDPGSFLIPCTFSKAFSCNALADLEPPFEKIIFDTDYKIKTSLEKPPLDLELKPLLDHLEYVFLEEPTFLPVIISSQLSEQNRNPMDQEKTTFTCPFGTYAFRRMPFGLCNAPATFERCMLAIFHDMIEESVEVFMDDFSLFGNSFNNCLNNLDKMLQRCKDANLVLNWEKCHFMIKEGIVLRHKVFSACLEVDKAKIDIMLLQEFDIEIKDKKGTENVAADHLSRIDNDEASDDSDVDDNFPGKTLMELTTKDIPWFADFANYLVGDIIPKGTTYQQKNKLFFDLKNYFWEDPYIFKVCSDGMSRCCVAGLETHTILDQCHHGPIGGHYGPSTIAKKVLDLGFYWPTIIKEAHTLVRLYEACQKTRNISKRDEMPLNNIQVCEVLGIWGINFMGPFSKSYKFEYILVVVDYVSKWVEAQELPTDDARVFISFLKKLFSRFRMPKAPISDRVKHQYPSEYVGLYGKDDKTFSVNDHRLKLYHEEDNDPREELTP